VKERFPDSMKMTVNHDGTKLDIIAEVLVSYGITVWQGIPEAVLERLESGGYKVKKKKNRLGRIE
jgi:spore coat polysaccharide biosynthesis protein SpsF (cytidylyltransferase family)